MTEDYFEWLKLSLQNNKEKTMKVARLIHEAFDEKQIIEFSAESNILEYIDQVERLLIAAGFPPEIVEDAFITKAEDIEIKEMEKAEERANEENNLDTD